MTGFRSTEPIAPGPTASGRPPAPPQRQVLLRSTTDADQRETTSDVVIVLDRFQRADDALEVVADLPVVVGLPGRPARLGQLEQLFLPPPSPRPPAGDPHCRCVTIVGINGDDLARVREEPIGKAISTRSWTDDVFRSPAY